MKPYFFGKYYKFVSPDGYSFAVIDSYSDEGKALQIITPDGGYSIENTESVKVGGGELSAHVKQNGIELNGKIKFGKLNPLKKKAMGPFSVFSMECSHDIYSMYHSLSGEITVNGQSHGFDGGFGYIEGDKGRSFPEKYVWYNSIGSDYGVTAAIATIPFGFISFTGVLCFVSHSGKEYRLCTYNFAKAAEVTPQEIVIEKGRYKLTVRLTEQGGYALKAPKNGEMGRVIKENLSVSTEFCFTKGDRIILNRRDEHSSLEFMY